MERILIADDNKDITDILSTYVTKEGWEPVVANDGEEAMDLFNKSNPTAVLLDVMMPKEDGYEVCRRIRKTSNTPVIIITARGEDFEKIMGLDIGADDYVVKPFSPSEVMARIRAVVRRLPRENDASNKDDIITIGGTIINIEEYSLSIGNENIRLTKREVEMIWTLAKNKGKVFTRENLLNSLWGFDYIGEDRTVDSLVKRLRSKVDKFEHPEWNIKTIRGVGYTLEVTE